MSWPGRHENLGFRATNGFHGSRRLKIVLEAIPALAAPGIIVGGIVSGYYTATEAGVAACVYGLVVGVFIYRELNPVENVWQYLRQNRLANTVFDSYDAIVDACCDAWNTLAAQPGTIRSIATRQWASVTL